MMTSTEFGRNGAFGLSRAILVYSDGRQSFATVHQPKRSPDGGAPYLDIGEPLTIEFLRGLAKGLGRNVPQEILPENVLVRTPDMLVWWSRRQHRMLFYNAAGDGRTLNGKVFPQPALVFKVFGSELFVRALAENERPVGNTPLMVAPYWNCDRQSGRVCQGSMRTPTGFGLEAIVGWERAFFESEFTHAALGAALTTHPEGFLGLWRDLAGSQSDFPSEFLLKSRDSLQSWIWTAGE
jgi:PRTRC genetic system protein B